MHAVDALQRAQQSGRLTAQDVTPELLGRCLRTQVGWKRGSDPLFWFGLLVGGSHCLEATHVALRLICALMFRLMF